MRKRFISFLLVIAILLTVLISCAPGDNGKTDPGETTDPSGYNEDKTALQNAMAQYNSGVLESLRGQTLTVLTPSPGKGFYSITSSTENEVFYEEPSTDPLSNAVYRRNRKVEDTLGIKIEAQFAGESAGTYDVWGVLNTVMVTNHNAGDKAFNAIDTRMDNEMTYAMNGQLWNYYKIGSMNLENRWWDQNIVDGFTIYGNVLYVLTGDINYYDDYSVQAVLFNKKIADELQLEYPYQAVRDGTWTVDMMTEMAVLGRVDVGGDDVYTPGVDQLGLADDMDCVIHFLYCYGLTMSTVNQNGEPEVVWPNETNTSVVEKVVDIFTSTYVSRDTGGNIDHFRNGKIFMYCSLLGSLPGLRNMSDDFGVVPMPKGSVSQDGYHAYMSNGWSTAYAVPITLSDEEAYNTGMMLECMSAASKDIITPALYDKLLEAKYIRDPESKEMLEYVFNSKVYDWAGDLDWASALRKVYQDLPTNSNGAAAYARLMQKIKKPVEASLKDMLAGLRKMA